ncbi:MAG: NAD(P)-dependent alcohol dehydrogenase [Anaerolineae bacterium]|nr:NAD(P)-dependent alcohol dehydrogenase [Anaerolineae bacterium]
MKAARLYGPGDMRIDDIPVPEPGPGEVLLQVLTVGICGSGVHYFLDGGIGDDKVTEPYVIGHEFSARIVALGPGVEGPAVGSRVSVEPAISCGKCEFCLEGHPNLCENILFCSTPPTPGALQEYMVHPAELCFPIPDEIDDAQGSALEPLGVALHAVSLAKLRPGDTVAILGAGPIGLLTLQVARLSGARAAFVTDLVAERLEVAKKMGATAAFKADAGDPVAWVMEQTAGRGVDVVFEAAWADQETTTQAANMVRRGGKMMMVGIPREDMAVFPAHSVRRKGVTIKYVRRMKHTYPRAIAMVKDGLIDLDNLITHHFKLDRASQAYELVASYKEGVIKAVIEVGR